MSRGQGETILVVSHHPEEREEYAGWMRRAGHGVRVAADADQALESLDHEAATLVVADRNLPDLDGHALAGRLRTDHPDAVLILVCDEPSVEDTVALMKGGAFHILAKPVRDEEIKVVVAKALEHGRLSRGNRDLKQRLDLTEKLAMIGRLASGVAHELNNPLDGVRRYVRLTQESLSEEEEALSEYLEHAMSGLTRMTGIVRQLLTFSRNVVIENEEENLRGLLEEVVRTLSGGRAGPVVLLENPFIDIHVPKPLFQVFVNLLKNALDATESRGSRGRVKIVVHRDEETVEIRVRDNGVGIEPDSMRRVFEPFYTTKDVGKGTGLGLPISARIVERSGGTLRIESAPGSGTIVTVSLPARVTTAQPTPLLQGTEQR